MQVLLEQLLLFYEQLLSMFMSFRLLIEAELDILGNLACLVAQKKEAVKNYFHYDYVIT
jgi:hypothetical protein